MRIVITGEIQSGKSTVLNKVRKEIPSANCQGLLTLPIIENKVIQGFYLKSLDGSTETFAHVDFDKFHSFGMFGLHLDVFDDFGCNVLHHAMESDYIILDELGVMEQNADAFVKEVVEIFQEKKNVLAVIQQRALDFWRSKIGEDFIDMIFTVTLENRNTLHEKILNHLKP
jgi:nucleoside-triphosphatase THEP1